MDFSLIHLWLSLIELQTLLNLLYSIALNFPTLNNNLLFRLLFGLLYGLLLRLQLLALYVDFFKFQNASRILILNGSILHLNQLTLQSPIRHLNTALGRLVSLRNLVSPLHLIVLNFRLLLLLSVHSGGILEIIHQLVRIRILLAIDVEHLL